MIARFFQFPALFWLLSLLSCLGNVRDPEGDPTTGTFDDALGAYSGTLAIGHESFSGIVVQVWREGPDRVRIGSSSDFIQPFACQVYVDEGILMQEDDARSFFLSVNLNATPARLNIYYSATDTRFLGDRLN